MVLSVQGRTKHNHHNMLLQRLQAFFLVLLLVTVAHHLLKDTLIWRVSHRPVLPIVSPTITPLFVELPTSYTEYDPTVLYAFNPMTPTPTVRTGHHRPLQKFVYRRRGFRGH